MELNNENYNDDNFLSNQAESSNNVLRNVRVENAGGVKTLQHKHRLTIAISLRSFILIALAAIVFLAFRYIQSQKQRLDKSIGQLERDTDQIKLELISMKKDDPIAAEAWKNLTTMQQTPQDITKEEIQDAFDRLLKKYNIKDYQLQVGDFYDDTSGAPIKTKHVSIKYSSINLRFRTLNDTILYELLDEFSGLDGRLPGLLIMTQFGINRPIGPLRYYDEIRISEGNFGDYMLDIDLTFLWYNIWKK